jgi:phospholipid/cholesterol/gamma-HCH transport system substrate-binding protein
METRANYALIGLFTLAVIAAGFGFVFWFSGGEGGQRRQPYRVVFSGSVSGLTKGSVVLFNGIRAGEVTEMRLLPEDPRRVLAIIEVDRAIPIRTDTRARLEFQGLTGVGSIALTGGEPGAPPLTAGPGQPLPTIFADRSDFQDLMETARNLARRADDFLEKMNRLVGDNEGAVNRTVQNVERFSQALSDNAPGIDRFLAQVGQAAERVGPLAARLETLAANLDELVRAVDRQQVSRIVTNVDNFTQALGDNRQAINDTLRDAASLAKRLNESAPKLDSALTDVSNLAKAFDPAKVGRVVDNADRFAQALGNSSTDVERAIKEARSITEKLNKSADRVDDVLKSAQTFLGSATGEAGKGAFDEVREAARSIRILADNLDKRTAAIASGLTRFTNSGLREYEALATEGRRTVNDVGRTVRSLEKNPQQLIFGGKPNLPEYNGRR